MALLIQEALSVEAERVFSDMVCIRCFRHGLQSLLFLFKEAVQFLKLI